MDTCKNLNLGSGKQRVPGYLNVDISPKCKPDYVWDITKIPYPREWATDIEKIRADNLCEHIEPHTLIKVINHWNEIMIRGGVCWIRVPVIKIDQKHLDAVFRDPTHVNYFTERTFDYWDEKNIRHRDFGRDYNIVPWRKIRNEIKPPFLIVELQKI